MPLVIGSNDVMAIPNWKKKQESFFLPVPLRDAIAPILAAYAGAGNKRKWELFSAALIAFAEMGDVEIRRRLGEIGSADSSGDWSAIVERIRQALDTPDEADEPEAMRRGRSEAQTKSAAAKRAAVPSPSLPAVKRPKD